MPNAAINAPKLAMRVRLREDRTVTAFGESHVLPAGSFGIIDCVHENNVDFWVITDDGGFFGWTNFSLWAFTGEYAEVDEGWLQLRVSRK